ncbi:hypothetical protein K501DRAFT_240772 [Backusella circina FSU 941]|nr:hypothetical protein K501DRAFT_240772 [Backusella circina FSU 941]
MLKVIFKPSINFVISSFLAIALLLVFIHVDGKKLTYTIIGLRIPSLISLILAIVKVFICSGISMAIAENKWIKLSNGADLTLIDIYDGCTRGLGGAFHLAKSMQFDFVLIPALLFQVGLLAMSPVSQELLGLKNVTISLEDDNFSDMIVYSVNNMFYTDYSGYAATTNFPVKIRGIDPMSFITTVAFSTTVSNYTSSPIFWCPDQAKCTFNNISQISTSMTCQNITDGEIVHPTTGNLTTLSALITNTSIYNHRFPYAFYSGEMVNRTYEKLGNFTFPKLPGFNITLDFDLDKTYDPQYKQYVGDQVFVVAAPASKANSGAVLDVANLYYQKCWFNSSLDGYNWATDENTLSIIGKNYSMPITMDYDGIIGNNTALGDNLLSNKKAQVMVNAYAIQQSFIYEMVRPKYYTLSEYVMQWHYMNNREMNFNLMMDEVLKMFNLQFIQFPFIVTSGGANTPFNKQHGIATFVLGPYYAINMVNATIFSLALLIPTFWWITIWLRSYRQSNGVLRGSSQIILLSTDVSDLARKQLHGFSNMDSSDAFAKAKQLRMRIGKNTDPTDQVLIIGLHGEKNLNHL